MQTIVNTVSTLFRSSKFIYIVAGLLVVQALWFVLSAQYPLAFDENFHFGIIKLFAEQWSPFFSETPPDSGAYGALTRDPSYLFHYLMSFPYRFISIFTDNEVAQIIFLRLLNVAMFTGGLLLFRILLVKIGIGRRLAHFLLLMLIFIPAVPFLAAHINYDNLLFLLLPLIISLAITCARSLRQSNQLPAVPLLALVILSLLTALVKYVFLPILLAVGLYLLVVFWQQENKKQALLSFVPAFSRLRPLVKISLIIGLLVSSGLFFERNIVNLLHYRTPSPDCSQVESVEHCLQYGPWRRDYGYAQNIKSGEWTKPDPNPIPYAREWANGMLYRLYFAINYDYSNKPPLALPFFGSMIIGTTGALLFIIYARRILVRNPWLRLPLAVSLVYAAALFYKNYTMFLDTSVAVALNGRYFIPLLPFIFTFIALGYREFFKLFQQPWRSYATRALVLFTVAMVLQGGGMLTFLVRSEPDWYWQNQTVIDVNQTLQRIATPLILGAD